MKMNERNAQLKSALGAMAPKERVVESHNLPKEDTVNRQGHAAYSVADELRLVAMLNTLKIEPQAYRNETEMMRELRDLIEKIGIKDPYFLAQAIVWSRCMGEGMRSINHLAATLAAPFIAGQEWARRFYGPFDKRNQRGGCIFRPDDMSEIKDVWAALNKKSGSEKMKSLPNAMKKGFAKAIETLDTYSLAKYKSSIIDVSNLVHPNPENSKATLPDGMKVIDALMKGIAVTADTWEAAQSEAGQEVAKAVKEGKLSKSEAEKVLAEAKADNWESLLMDGKLGILAALRNIRNIMKTPRANAIHKWCELITNKEKIRKSLILPIHFDLAYEIVMEEFDRADYSPTVQQALLDGYAAAIPNLKDALPGRTCVIVDCSGSMHTGISRDGKAPNARVRWGIYENDPLFHTTCSYKAGLIAATIAKATGADIVRFGSGAQWYTQRQNLNLFSLAREISKANMGGTDLSTAFDLLTREHKAYDRIIVVSDNEINGRVTSRAYQKYIHDVCSPYVYACDMAAYGTTPLKNDGKVNYYFGYGPAFYEDIARKEFNPSEKLELIRKVVI